MSLLVLNPQKILISDSVLPLSSAQLFHWFQLIDLVFQSAILLFWFALTALISIVYNHSRQHSAQKLQEATAHYLSSTKQQTDKVGNKLVNIMKHFNPAAMKTCWSFSRNQENIVSQHFKCCKSTFLIYTES